MGAPALATMPTNYFRLLAPYIYAKGKQIIYLDADTLVLEDITPLAAVSLEGHAVGAVLDWLPRIRDGVVNWAQLGLNGDMPYFNSGVLVMDIGKWQRDCIAARAFEVCVQNRKYLAAQGKWMQHEQYGLNVVVEGLWCAISSIWNHFTELPSGVEPPRILHYLGQGKPHSFLCRLEFREIFKSMLKHTPWKEWLPNDPPK